MGLNNRIKIVSMKIFLNVDFTSVTLILPSLCAQYTSRVCFPKPFSFSSFVWPVLHQRAIYDALDLFQEVLKEDQWKVQIRSRLEWESSKFNTLERDAKCPFIDWFANYMPLATYDEKSSSKELTKTGSCLFGPFQVSTSPTMRTTSAGASNLSDAFPYHNTLSQLHS